MAYFKLDNWTTCQTCVYGNRFVHGLISNLTDSLKTIVVVIGDENDVNVGQTELNIPANSYELFFIEPDIPIDYTGDIHCIGYYNTVLQFNAIKRQYFDAEDGCAAPGVSSNISAICQPDGSCKLTWTPPSDGDIFEYIVTRYKNAVFDSAFGTKYPNMHDNTITDCGSQYSYGVETVDLCLNLSVDSPHIVPGDAPPVCPIPVSDFTVDNKCVVGTVLSAISTSQAGEGESIVEYYWALDNVRLDDVSIVLKDTTGFALGPHILTLKVKNSCGNWSSIQTKSIDFTSGDIPDGEPTPAEDADSYIIPVVIACGIIGSAILIAVTSKK